MAAAVFAFYMSILFFASLQAPEGWGPLFGALAGLYGVGFVALVAGYFWGRWFAIGLGISGLISAAMSIWQIGFVPELVFYGATHAFASLILWGQHMAQQFDGRAEWRERYHLDEAATHRLGKSIIRVGISLPYIVMYALAPREGAAVDAMLAAALVATGAWALARLRTWGLVAIAGGAALLFTTLDTAPSQAPINGVYAIDVIACGVGALLFALAALAPMAGPVARYLRAER